MIDRVEISDDAVKALRKVPEHVRNKLLYWVELVERLGLNVVSVTPGWHDEPLKGKRAGQRSIRLNRAYRAIYVIKTDGSAELVRIEEVSKHDY